MPWAAWRRRFRSRTIAAANEQALEKVRQDKLREVKAGHDGTWVAHPGPGSHCERNFRHLHARRPIRLRSRARIVHITAQDLLKVPAGDITEAGLRWNIDVGIAVSRFLAARIGLRAHL